MTQQSIDPMHIIALTSTRRCGKDTIYQHFHSLNRNIVRFAFADALKEDLRPLISKQFGFDIMDCTTDQKELVRDILIAYGMTWRAVDPLHWVKVVVNQISSAKTVAPSIIPCVTDVRFENEAQYLRDTFGARFSLINLMRDGSPPPTEEEKKHFKQVAEMADSHLKWGNNTAEEQRETARRVLENQLGIKTVV